MKKVWITAIPILAGALVLVSLWKINAPRRETAQPATSPTTAVPQNAAHEQAALEEQLTKNPDHIPILMRLAELEREAGRPSGAIPHLKKILGQDPKQQDARLELGRALYDTGDTVGALRETKQLIADYPNNVDGLYNLGAIYANQNQFALARDFWTKAAAISPESESGRKAQEGLAKIGAAR